jgi:hypothetical protein
MPAPVRVLRGVASEPHEFGPLPASEPTAAPPAFAPTPLVAVPEPAPAPEPAPPTYAAAALDAARAEGAEAGRRERDGEVGALRAEVERLTRAQTDAAQAAEAQATTVDQAAGRLAALWAEAVRALEPDLAALAVDVAEAVVAAPLSDRQRDAAARALADAVDRLAGALPVTVHLHPVALLRLREAGLAEALEHAHALRWEPDDRLGPDEWTAETDEGAVRRLRGPVFAALRDRLGLDAPDAAPADAAPADAAPADAAPADAASAPDASALDAATPS